MSDFFRYARCRRLWILAAIIAARSSFGAAPVHGQQTVDSLQVRLARLEAQLAQLEFAASVAPLGGDSVEYLAGRGGTIYLPRRPLSTPRPGPLPVPGTATPVKSPLEVSGFLEGVATVAPRDGRNNSARLNQAEIDLGRELSAQARADVGVYYAEGEFSLVAASVSFAPLASAAGDDASPVRLVKDVAFTAGQFDVPFGLDYLVYAPLDRPLVSMPRPVAASYGFWNDLGVCASVGGTFGALDLYAVKGFETTFWTSDEPLPADVADDDERWQTTQPSVSGGLRFNVVPLAGIDAGLSLARGWNRSGASSLTLAGLHLQRSAKVLTLKAEALQAATAEDVRPQHLRGAYLEATERLGRPFLVQRADALDRDGAGRQQGYSLGAGWTFSEGLEGRAEYGWESLSRTPQIHLQLVAGF